MNNVSKKFKPHQPIKMFDEHRNIRRVTGAERFGVEVGDRSRL